MEDWAIQFLSFGLRERSYVNIRYLDTRRQTSGLSSLYSGQPGERTSERLSKRPNLDCPSHLGLWVDIQ